MRFPYFPVAAILAMLLAAPVVAGEPIGLITAAVDDVVARYGLPGIAVGVVADGQVLQVEVRGETVAGSEQSVGRGTLFKIASNTKAMTAALLARQVDAGLLAWDDPVVKHLPDFRMYEDWVTHEIQVRDLLIHNSGLGPGAGDLMLWPEPNAFTRKEVVDGLTHLKPRWSFRSRYAYDNILYIVAGEVAAAAGRAPFDVLLQREVFAPLGMDGCRLGEWRTSSVASVAAPHLSRDGEWVARPDGPVVADMPMAAAGGVRCGLDDMLRWAQAWLDPDVAGGWLSDAQREAVWAVHMPMRVSQRMRDWNNSHFNGYGYGWRLTDVDGTAKVSHTGTLSGMYSAVTLLPELGVGFVILINADAGQARTVLEQVLGKHFTAPQEARTVRDYADALEQEREIARAAGTAGPTPDVKGRRRAAASGPITGWLGHYRDPWFGEVRVCPVARGVRFESAKSPRLSGTVLESAGKLLVEFDTLGTDANAWLEFGPGNRKGPPRLTMAKVDPDADFSYDYEDLAFVRVGDCDAVPAVAGKG